VTRIGVLSDTHGLLREEVLRELRGSVLILHAGDVGRAEILEELRRIAPVVAVRGNVDTAEWAKALPVAELVEAGGAKVHILHNLEELDLNPRAAGIDIVISGHTHRPARFEKDGVLYLNPGSAGPRRFALPISLARMRVDARPWEVEFVELEGKPDS